MSVAPPPQQAPAQVTPAPGEACPLCGSALRPEQDWCVNCGAAARTRLAAAPGWKAPIIVVVVLVALALGVLTAALVKLAGGSPSPPPITRTLGSTPGALAPAAGAGAPATSTPVPAVTLPTSTTAPTTSAPASTAPPGRVPGAGTTPRTGSARPLFGPGG